LQLEEVDPTSTQVEETHLLAKAVGRYHHHLGILEILDVILVQSAGR
jgi:hypothetical protein